MKKLMLSTVITILIVCNSFAQVHWTKYAGNPIMEHGASGEWDGVSMGPGTIMFYDNMYHMYYDGLGMFNDGHGDIWSWGIGLAVSQDGINWERNENNPLLVLGESGEWDAFRISDAFVVKIDTLFHMWYTASASADAASIHRIGHATSPDGIEWTKDPDNPVKDILEGLDSTSYCMHAPVMFDGNLYHMYYSTGKWGSGVMEIWHATSLDGYKWTKDPQNPVMKDGFIYATCVIYDGEKYIMWYGNGGYWNWKIHLAFSADGSNWEKYENNPVLTEGPSGSWDAGCPTRAIVLFDSNEHKYKMWYAASKVKSSSPETIGYAESDTCSDHNIPIIQCDSTIIRGSEYIEVTSSEDGIIYLIPSYMSQDLQKIRESCIDSIEAIANVNTSFQLTELPNDVYTIYARDKSQNVSTYHRFRINIKDIIEGVNNNNTKLPISIYPNPASNKIYIETTLIEKRTIEITTINGQMKYNAIMEDSEVEIDISALPGGVYLITIRSKHDVTTQKFIKL